MDALQIRSGLDSSLLLQDSSNALQIYSGLLFCRFLMFECQDPDDSWTLKHQHKNQVPAPRRRIEGNQESKG